MNDNIKIVIEIDETTYKDIKKGKVYSSVRDVPQESVLAIAHGTPLDSVKAEFINRYPTNWAGEPELGGASCEFSLCKVLEILDNIGKESEEE